MKYFFISDTHFGHANIIKYCHRPFKECAEMDFEIIKRWNEVVKPGDVVFHLGDFCFKHSFEYYMKMLNGKVILLKGNHENGNSIIDDMTITLGGYQFYLTHRPENCKAEFNLCGHIHQLWKTKRIGNSILINVGVDVWDFAPVSIEAIIKEIKSYSQGTDSAQRS